MILITHLHVGGTSPVKPWEHRLLSVLDSFKLHDSSGNVRKFMNLKTKKLLARILWFFRLGPPYCVMQSTTLDLEGNQSLPARRIVAISIECLKCGAIILEPIKDQPEQIQKHFRDIHGIIL